MQKRATLWRWQASSETVGPLLTGAHSWTAMPVSLEELGTFDRKLEVRERGGRRGYPAKRVKRRLGGNAPLTGPGPAGAAGGTWPRAPGGERV